MNMVSTCLSAFLLAGRCLAVQDCSANQRCHGLGLSGDCCPTGDGAMLDCCDAESLLESVEGLPALDASVEDHRAAFELRARQTIALQRKVFVERHDLYEKEQQQKLQEQQQKLQQEIEQLQQQQEQQRQQQQLEQQQQQQLQQLQQETQQKHQQQQQKQQRKQEQQQQQQQHQQYLQQQQQYLQQ